MSSCNAYLDECVGCRCAKWKSLCRCLVNLVAGCVTTFCAHCWSGTRYRNIVMYYIFFFIFLPYLSLVFIVRHLCRLYRKEYEKNEQPSLRSYAYFNWAFLFSFFLSLTLLHAECRFFFLLSRSTATRLELFTLIKTCCTCRAYFL